MPSWEQERLQIEIDRVFLNDLRQSLRHTERAIARCERTVLETEELLRSLERFNA